MPKFQIDVQEVRTCSYVVEAKSISDARRVFTFESCGKLIQDVTSAAEITDVIPCDVSETSN